VENFQNLEGQGLIWKIFRNKELARFFAAFYEKLVKFWRFFDPRELLQKLLSKS